MESQDRTNQIIAFLNRVRLTENVYKAMQSGDVADAAMFVLEVLETIGMEPPQKLKKSEKLSDLYRKEGSRAYLNEKFEEAMELFNKALLFAPEGSKAMILAYSNRSALLHYKKLFAASLIDVERCLSMSCPSGISEKLKNRKRSCCIGKKQFGHEVIQSILHPEFLEKYLKLDKHRNPQIPCARAAVGVIMDAGVPKVVANEDIDVGTVVAVETSFVSQNIEKSYFTACYYCHKLTLNLIPCDTCCIALFCGEDCRTRCKEEYHDVECQIVEILPSVDGDTELALKAVLKMRNSCKSWDEFINASNKIGRERMTDSTVSDIFDGNNAFSLLNCDDEQYFKYGNMFNQSLMVSDILCQLRKIPSFLPNDTCKKEKKRIATRSLAKTMMFLLLFCKTTHFMAVALNVQEETEGTVKFGNRGMFSFLSKLNHCCNPNMLVVALNKEVALIAVQPIKRGTELTVSKLHHWLERSLPGEMRQAELFHIYNILCDCQICIGRKTDTPLSKAQKQYMKNIDLKKIQLGVGFPKTIEKSFCDLCKALSMVCDTPNSKEYEEVFVLFRECIIYFQQCKTKNVLLGVTDNEFSL